MKWNEIQVSEDNTHFIYRGEILFNKHFIEVLKFHSIGVAPVRDESGWYHIDSNGDQLYTERYSRTFGYYCGRAAVVVGNEWYHLNEKGLRSYDHSYSWVGNFQENLCTVRDYQNNYFHIDIKGDRVYRTNYLYAGDFKNGYACVKLHNRLYKHIDIHGNFINNREFNSLGVFHKNFAVEKDHVGWFHINKGGTELYSNRFMDAEPFYNGFALVTTYNNEQLIIDENGKIVITCSPPSVQPIAMKQL